MKAEWMLGFALLAGAAQAADQLVIYKGSDWGDPDPDSQKNMQIWSSASGCATGHAQDCAAIDVHAVTDGVNEAVAVLGEHVGEHVTTRSGFSYRELLVGVFPHNDGQPPGQYDPDFRMVKLPDNWQTMPYTGVVHHEVAHDFFYEHMPRRGYDSLEQTSLDEGVAMIVQQVAGGATIKPPHYSDIDVSMNLRGEHDGGRHLVKAFNALVESTSKQAALDAFLDAVRNFDDIDDDGAASFAEFQLAVLDAAGRSRALEVMQAFAPLGLLRIAEPAEEEVERVRDDPPPTIEMHPIGIRLAGFVCHWDVGSISCVRESRRSD